MYWVDKTVILTARFPCENEHESKEYLKDYLSFQVMSFIPFYSL